MSLVSLFIIGWVAAVLIGWFWPWDIWGNPKRRPDDDERGD